MLEAERRLPSLRFRDALNLKQMLLALIREGDRGSSRPRRENPLSPTLRRGGKPGDAGAAAAGSAHSPARQESRRGAGLVPWPGAGWRPHPLPGQGSSARRSRAGLPSPSPGNGSHFPIKTAPERGLL